MTLKYDIVETPEGGVKAVGECVFTKTPYETATFDKRDYEQWLSGLPIQNTGLIDLSSDDREFLITSTSPKFWEMISDE